MNKFIKIDHHKKAGVLACLFLLAALNLSAQDWAFSAKSQEAYDLVMNLEMAKAYTLLKDDQSADALYIKSLGQTIELLVTEDREIFAQYESQFENRLIKDTDKADPKTQFAQAEMRLHWSIINLKFGRELDAAGYLLQAFRIADHCRKSYPDFKPIRKTTGIIEIIVGSIPEKYSWLANLFGLKGTIPTGIQDLNVARLSQSSISGEADLLYALVQSFIFQDAAAAVAEAKTQRAKNPANRLLSFITASLAIKNSESEYALGLLDSLTRNASSIQLSYDYYLLGEVYLHKADYIKAIDAYKTFIAQYKGQNFVKDAYYKTGLCHYLSGNENEAAAVFKQARMVGKMTTEADKYAARRLADARFPNVILSKARYFTDGGYYEHARKSLDQIVTTNLTHKEEKVEYYYRRARLEHKQNRLGAARLFYSQTIDLSGDETWYYAPNACLQLGYIAVAEGNTKEARGYFDKAIGYPDHEYKNSIDAKAKSALAQLRTR